MASTDLWQLLANVRDWSVAALADTAPFRAYVTLGDPAYEDTDVLIVHPLEWATWPVQGTGGMAEPYAQQVIGLPKIPVTLTILRGTPGPALDGNPDIEDMEKATQIATADCWTLWNAWQRIIDDEPGPEAIGAAPHPPPAMVGARPITEQGLVFGWDLTIDFTLEGFRPTFTPPG